MTEVVAAKCAQDSSRKVLRVLDLSVSGNCQVLELELPLGVTEEPARAGFGLTVASSASFTANIESLSSPPLNWSPDSISKPFDLIVSWNPKIFSEQICDPLGVLCRLYNEFLAPGGTLLIGGLSPTIDADLETTCSQGLLWMFAWVQYLREQFDFRISLRVDSEGCAGWWLQRKPPYDYRGEFSCGHHRNLLNYPNVALGPVLGYHRFRPGGSQEPSCFKAVYKVLTTKTTSCFTQSLYPYRDQILERLATKRTTLFEGANVTDPAYLNLAISLLPSTRCRMVDKVEERLSSVQVDIPSFDRCKNAGSVAANPPKPKAKVLSKSKAKGKSDAVSTCSARRLQNPTALQKSRYLFYPDGVDGLWKDWLTTSFSPDSWYTTCVLLGDA
jgi:hypothetical protein